MKTIGKEFRNAVPFAIPFLVVPLIWLGAAMGGWWLVLAPIYGWYMLPFADWIMGKDDDNPDLDVPKEDLFWYAMVTWVWPPLQVLAIFTTVWYATHTNHLSFGEKIALFTGVGVISGSIGINFSHELMHQSSRMERWFADILLSTVLYSHFRSEHLLVHHVHVATPKDAVTAPYNTGFWRHFGYVLPNSLRSALEAEKAMLERKGLDAWDRSNPFYRYVILQFSALLLAGYLGGAMGLFLFFWQALIAVFQLELINYIEHYGLVREQYEDGKYEPVKPRHSWNATQRMSNLYLINLQRHSDHHASPSRPFPLLQT